MTNKRFRLIGFSVTFILILLALFPTPVSSAANWYASAWPVPGGDCTIGNECSLWDAVSLAGNGDTIYLRYGPYIAQDTTDEQVLYINKSLTIIGGCDASYTQCSTGYQYTSSFFDGELQSDGTFRRVITIQGNEKFRPSVTIKNLHIVRGDGFGITNREPCITEGSPVTAGCGGGIYADQLESLTIENCVFYDNYGAKESPAGALGSGFGGALYLRDIHNLQIVNNEFTSNKANNTYNGYGGAIALVNVHKNTQSDTTKISSNQFENNDCSNSSMGKGCAIYSTLSADQQISDNGFTNNNTPASPANLDGAAIYLYDSGGLKLSRNSFNGNYGSSLIWEWNHDITPDDHIEQNKFWDNNTLSLIRYTGIYEVHVVNNFFGHMVSPTTSIDINGGGQTAIQVSGPELPGDTPRLVSSSNTIAAISVGISIADNVTANINENIFAFITSVAIVGGTPALIDKNLFFNNFTDGNVGVNPIYDNPHFKNIAVGDFHLTSISGAKDRSAGSIYSPAIDIDSQFRPFGSSATPYDIGADEYMLGTYLPLISK